jgi:hypothetical protein
MPSMLRAMADAASPACLGIAAQRQHEGVAVDDAGGRREQGGVAVQGRLQFPRGLAREGLQIEHAIGFGVRPDRLQLFGFLGRGGDDQLAAIAVRNAVHPAVFIERPLAADAHPRHQAAGLVIDAGVNHLAVARGRDGADAFGSLQHDHLASGLCEPPCDRKTDHARTDNDALYLVHSRVLIPWDCWPFDLGCAVVECRAFRINRAHALLPGFGGMFTGTR